MTETVLVQLDEASQRALHLLQRPGRSRSEAIRMALVEAASRRRSDEALREEARRLMANPEYRREVAEIQAFMS